MSATTDTPMTDGATFVKELCAEPGLAAAVRENGIVTAASEAGFDVTRSEIETAIKAMVLEKHTPEIDIDIFEAQNSSPGTSDIFCAPE